MTPLLLALLTEIVVPELARYLKARAEAGLPPPTQAELEAETHRIVTQVIVPVADSFIARVEADLKAAGKL